MSITITPLLNPYCTLNELIHELKQKEADVMVDEQLVSDLQEAINNASRWIDEYKREDFLYHDYRSAPLEFDEFSDCVFQQTLILPYKKIISIDEVKIGDRLLVDKVDYVRHSFKLMKLNGGAGFSPDFTAGHMGNTGMHWNPRRPDSVITIKAQFGYAQNGPQYVPIGIPAHISLACRLVAAAFSGHNRKEVTGLDGSKTDMLDREIPKTVYQMLGKRAPLMV